MSSARSLILPLIAVAIGAAVLAMQFRQAERLESLDIELGGEIARINGALERHEHYRALRVVPPEKRDLLYPAAKTWRPGDDLPAFRRTLREDLSAWIGIDRELTGRPVDYRSTGRTRIDSLGIVRERVEMAFDGHDEWLLRGYLLYPDDGAGAYPAVLCLNGHGGSAAAVAGIEEDYTNSYGLALAGAGMLVLAFDWCFEGDSRLADGDGAVYAGHDSVLVWSERTGRTGLALYMENARCAFAALREHPLADTSRLAVTGISRGGELTTYFAALFADEIDAYYASGAGFPFVYRRFGGGCKCTFVPQIFENYEFSDLQVAAAPLPCRLQLGVRDDIWGYWDNIAAIMRTVPAAYDSLGAPDNFGLDIHAGEHVYDVDQGVRFFRRTLIEPQGS